MFVVAYWCIGAYRMAAVDSDYKRWWLTQWKTKVPVIVSNFFLGLIGDSIVNMPSTLAFGVAHIIEHKSIS